MDTYGYDDDYGMLLLNVRVACVGGFTGKTTSHPPTKPTKRVEEQNKTGPTTHVSAQIRYEVLQYNQPAKLVWECMRSPS